MQQVARASSGTLPSPLGLVIACAACVLASAPLPAQAATWWKGNLHTHSLWSDGDDYPEMIAAWYKDNGYHFLVFTEHNTLLEGENWFTLTPRRGSGVALEKYRARFGDDWVERRREGEAEQVRLRTLEEFRPVFDEAGRFLLLAGEEITDRFHTAPLHINVSNVRDFIPPQGGSNVVDVLQRNVDAVLAQREATGQPMFPHINHPNFGWAITAEELMQIRGEQFFEVYNGHPAVHNDGDATRPGTERMWDIALTWRLAFLGLDPMYGLATDDGHNYHEDRVGLSNPGRGWVMVRCDALTPEALIHALEDGDFYSSSGVTLRDVQAGADRYRVEVEPEPDVGYVVEFIGTRLGFDASNEPLRSPAGTPLRVTHRYSTDIGTVLKVVNGTVAEYRPRGDELYVRARVTSSRTKANPYREGEVERAWTQPVVVQAPALSPAGRLLHSPRPLVIAHRGYSGIAPENTRIAFQRALEARADLVELDYYHSLDGVPVVHHDHTLDRTTDAIARWGGKQHRIAGRTWAELQTLDAGSWFEPAHPGEGLPSLLEALRQIQSAGVTLVERKAGDAATAVALLRDHQWINRLVVQSFDWAYLRDFHELAPEQILGALGPQARWQGQEVSEEDRALSDLWLDRLQSTGARVVVWNRQVDAHAVRAAHARGLKVWVYTINDGPLAHELLDAGVDGIITDHPALLWHVLAVRSLPGGSR